MTYPPLYLQEYATAFRKKQFISKYIFIIAWKLRKNIKILRRGDYRGVELEINYIIY
jgi:hypothetical protein